MSLSVSIKESIADVSRDDWDELEDGDSPFLRSGFLQALEESGSVGDGTGWRPFYVTVKDGETWLGATVSFIKSHSYGEYIFDWAWANAYQQSGRSYYPKCVIAAPFTPATGKRFLLKGGVEVDAVVPSLIGAVEEIADSFGCSSIHILFCEEKERESLTGLGYLPRLTHQFHWKNRAYESYDGFLQELTSRKRKQLKKERRRALENIERIDFCAASEVANEDIDRLDGFYRKTVSEHHGMDYLKPGFFHVLKQTLPKEMRIAKGAIDGVMVAGALFLQTNKKLFGRYWGASTFVEQLHFEMAYYTGIEYAIDNKLELFEAGAQGDHKLLRGFEPSETYSAHKMLEPGFHSAIRQFLDVERQQVAHKIEGLKEYLPYKKNMG